MERAVVFVDGNNWYHALKEAGLTRLGWLNYAKVSAKLIGAREWTGTRYYIGQVQQRGNADLYADQRRYMAWLQSRDTCGRITVHYGRLEERREINGLARELRKYLGGLSVQIDLGVYRTLVGMAKSHETTTFMVEKAVDVMLAVDLVRMAVQDEFDAAYILSADGDFTPAAKAAKEVGKKVFAASINPGAQLAREVFKSIPISRDWLTDCFGE